LPFQKSWQVSKREGVIKNVVDAYKFKSIRAAAGPLAELFDQHLPQLPSNTVIVPIPTVPKHIRQRGFAHMEIVTRKLAKLKGCCYSELLKRKNNTVQFGQNAKTRQAQAKQAFACPTTLDPNANYLIIDDICTTGATLIEAAKVLKKSGAKNVWVAVLAHQSLK
jgi:ComF family protein